MRALEHYRATGKSSSRRQHPCRGTPLPQLILGLDFPEQAALYRHIDLRVDKMLDAGLLAEAELVWNNRSPLPHRGAGHRLLEFFPYFERTASLETLRGQAQTQASRNYAKRQLTWFRHMDGVVWLDAGAPEVQQCACRTVQEFLSKG